MMMPQLRVLCHAAPELSSPHSPHAVATTVVQLLRQGDELGLHRNFRALGTASIIKCAAPTCPCPTESQHKMRSGGVMSLVANEVHQ